MSAAALYVLAHSYGGAVGSKLAALQSPSYLGFATLGREPSFSAMTALERALNRRLFERGARGYTLTAAGRDLLAETRHFWLENSEGQVVSTLRLMEEHPGGQ